MENNLIPPTLNYDETEPKYNIELVKELIPYPLDTAMKLSCGFAGYNAAAIFKKYDCKPNYTDFKNHKEDKYDVVIIGAGIGGLVCGCYLAKAGLKVLIVEQHYKPGGYCTSFERGGYTFDVGVHYLGSCRERDGVIYNILQDLSLLNKIKLSKK